VLCALVAAPGCSGKDSDSGSVAGKAPAGAAAEPSPPARPPDPRDGKTLWRSLLETQGRAERRVGGVVIDLGTADSLKYTRGGWASGWTPAVDAAAGEPTYAIASGLGEGDARVRLWTLVDSQPAEMVVRARSAKGTQNVALYAGGRKLGSVSVGSDWTVVRAPVEKLDRGPARLGLVPEGGPVHVDWIWLAEAVGADEPLVTRRVSPVRVGGAVRRALLAPGGQRLSYYVLVPEKAAFIADVGATAASEFSVHATTDQADTVELARLSVDGTWKPLVVDLSAYAGRVVRLDLETAAGAAGAGWGEPGLFVDGGEAPEPAPVKGKPARNLIWVVMDTTRADSYDAMYPGTEVETPAYDAFAKRSTTFSAAYNNSNWTKPSVATFLSGLYPWVHTATTATAWLPDEVRILPQHLKELGFYTMGRTANPVVSGKFGFDKGWDDYEVDETRAEKFYERALDLVRQPDRGDRRFFLYLQSIDPHVTYRYRDGYTRRYHPEGYSGRYRKGFARADENQVNGKEVKASNDDVSWVRALYRGEVSYQDEYIGVFLKGLEKDGLLDDTLVIITNDHGEEVFDRGAVGHGWQLYDDVIQAPLLIYYPPMFPQGKVVHQVVEHVDLPSTITEALGVAPMPGVQGRSLLGLFGGQPRLPPDYAMIYSDNGKRALRVGPWKLIVHHDKGWHRLFRLDTKERETKDLKRQAPLAGRLAEILLGEANANPNKAVRTVGAGGGQRFNATDANIDAETRKKLEALGYL